MYENILATLPAEAPRSLAALPGLRLTSLLPPFLIFPLIFAAFFVMIPVTMSQNEPIYRLQHGETAIAQGRVESIAGCPRCGGTIQYVFKAADGQEYRNSELSNVSSTAGAAALQPGDALPIVYLSANPAVNAPAANLAGHNEPPLAFIFLASLFPLLMFAPLWLPPLRLAWRERHIARHGRLTEAKIFYVKARTQAWPGLSITGNADVFLTYQDMTGQMIEARAKCANQWLIGQLAPEKLVHIAYLPGRPMAAVLLEAYIR
jgi:hypothetical protein